MPRWNIIIALLFVLFLSGCLYPESERQANTPPDEAQINQVQQAIDQYQENTDGLLPIKTIEDPDEYMKYQIEFERLVPNYISERPANSYEAGGTYQYIIIDAEEDPQVKLADLQLFEALRSLQLRIQGMGPHVELGEEIGPNVYALDLEYYELDENPTVKSPYSDNLLNVYYSGGQQWVIDYRSDIGHIINDQKLTFETGDDVRKILYEYTPIVPIFSPEITVDENNEPIFMTNQHKNR